MFSGSIPALITPFNNDFTIDFDALVRLVRWHIKEGSDALCLLGTTGESPTIYPSERTALIKTVVKEAKGNFPIVVGCGTNSTLSSIELVREAKKLGVDAALVVVPYYNRPTEKGCYEHFRLISKEGLPLIIYHHPGRTGITLSTKALVNLYQLQNVIGIKEASDSVDPAANLLKWCPDIKLFSGNDDLALEFMRLGGVGSISVVANLLPNHFRKMLFSAPKEGDLLLKQLQPLLQALFLEVNPQGIKYAMHLKGMCSSTLRLPLMTPRKETCTAIANELAKIASIETFV